MHQMSGNRRALTFGVAAVLAGLVSGAALAADLSIDAPDKEPATIPEGIEHVFDIAFGTRYWVGMGTTAKDLYNIAGDTLVSRLTYDGLTTHSGEVFGEIERNNFFLKGFAGLGAIAGGNLRDEDFPPLTTPYSSTDSPQRGGFLGYATIDAGLYIHERGDDRLGVFVGYNFLRQNVDAYGCTQNASHPSICVPTVDDSVAVISQTNDWQSLRVGLNGEVNRGKWRLRGEAAVLPHVSLNGYDSHWLRMPPGCTTTNCFTGAIPEDGTGWGVQLEAMLDYHVHENGRVGVGVRYWHMQTRGHTHFENRVVGVNSAAQPVNWMTSILGLTAEASFQF